MHLFKDQSIMHNLNVSQLIAWVFGILPITYVHSLNVFIE